MYKKLLFLLLSEIIYRYIMECINIYKFKNSKYDIMEPLVAWYEEKSRLLRIFGPITRKIIQDVFVPHSAYSYSPENMGEDVMPEEIRRGNVSFLVSSEPGCSDLIEKLKPELKEHGFSLEYQGKVEIIEDLKKTELS